MPPSPILIHSSSVRIWWPYLIHIGWFMSVILDNLYFCPFFSNTAPQLLHSRVFLIPKPKDPLWSRNRFTIFTDNTLIIRTIWIWISFFCFRFLSKIVFSNIFQLKIRIVYSTSVLMAFEVDAAFITKFSIRWVFCSTMWT